MSTVSVSIANADTSAKFSWSYPADNGDAVSEYSLMIKAKDGSFYTYLTTCDGADPTIVSQRKCYMPMQALRENPFLLLKGDKIIVIANAMNSKGFNASFSSS